MASLKRNNVNRRKFDRRPIDVDDLTSASSFSGIRDVIESHFSKPEAPEDSAFETDPSRLQYAWEPKEVPVSVRLDAELIDRLEKESIEIFRAITNRGSEIGGILLGRVFPGKRLIVVAEAYEPIPCAYDLGPSYVLTEEEQQSARDAVEAKKAESGLTVVGFFRSNTRATLEITEDDLALFDLLFPEEHNIALLAKPYSRKPCQGAIFVRESGEVRSETSYLEFAFSRAELEKNGELQPAIRPVESGRVTPIRPAAAPAPAPTPASVAPPAVPVSRVEPEPEPRIETRVAPPEPRVPPQSETKTESQAPASLAAGTRPVWRFRPQTEARTEPKTEPAVRPPAPPAPEAKVETPTAPVFRPVTPPAPEVKAEPPERKAEPVFRPVTPPKPETKTETPVFRPITPPKTETKTETPAFRPMTPPRTEVKTESPVFRPISPSKPETRVTPPAAPVTERPVFRPLVSPRPEAKVEAPAPPPAEKKREPLFRPAVPPKPEAKVETPVPPPVEKKPEPVFRPLVSPKPTAKVEAPERKTETGFRPMVPPKPTARVEPPATEKKSEPAFRPLVRPKPEAKLVTPAPPAAPKVEPAPKPAAPEVAEEKAPAPEPIAETPVQAVPDFRFGAEDEPQRSRKWLIVVAAVVLAVVVAFLFLRPSSKPTPPRRAAVEPVTEPAAPPAALALWAEGADGGVRIHWDGFAPELAKARHAVLTITDGTTKTKVDLGPAELKEGMYRYKPRTDDVTARIDLDDTTPGQHVSGTLRMLGARRMGPGRVR